MAQEYGSATISAQSQTPEGLVAGANPAQPAFLEYSACFVNASFVDSTNAPLAPHLLQYRIDDITSGEQILPWTSLTPASSLQIAITSAQNALISGTRSHETHQVLLAIMDPSGNGPFYARCLYDLISIPGVG